MIRRPVLEQGYCNRSFYQIVNKRLLTIFQVKPLVGLISVALICACQQQRLLPPVEEIRVNPVDHQALIYQQSVPAGQGSPDAYALAGSQQQRESSYTDVPAGYGATPPSYGAPAAQTSRVAQAGPGAQRYTVQLGDNLTDIARRADISLASLQQQNGLNDSNIYPGQQLLVMPDGTRFRRPPPRSRAFASQPPPPSRTGGYRQAPPPLPAPARRPAYYNQPVAEQPFYPRGSTQPQYVSERPQASQRYSRPPQSPPPTFVPQQAPQQGRSNPPLESQRPPIPPLSVPAPDIRGSGQPSQRRYVPPEPPVEVSDARNASFGYKPSGFDDKQIHGNASNLSGNQGLISWLWPLQGEVVRGFQQGRPSNSGIEIGCQPGDPVKAAAAGKVVYIGDGIRGFSRTVILSHGEGILSAYAKLGQITVRESQRVQPGQRIATATTNSGYSCVVYFQIRMQNEPINPLAKLPSRS